MKINTLCLLLLLPVMASSQTQENYSAWFALILNYKISDQFSLKNETHFRRTHFLGEWQQIIIRPSVSYELNESVEFAVGYTHSKNFASPLNYAENNVFEQASFHQRLGNSAFRHRFRMEQRYIEQIMMLPGGSYGSNSASYQGRMRYKFSWFIPLFRITANKKILLNAADEIGVNILRGIVPKSLNFNRLHLGIIYPILKNTLLEMGYDDSYSPRGSTMFNRNQVLQTTFTYQIR